MESGQDQKAFWSSLKKSGRDVATMTAQNRTREQYLCQFENSLKLSGGWFDF
jgi:hypothetical protein